MVSQSVCDCYLTRSCGIHADLELFMTECGALLEKYDREAMRWTYL